MSDKSLLVLRDHLIQSGIRNQDQLEELIDHYQTSLEFKIENGKSYDDALQATISELIEARHIPTRNGYNRILISLMLIFSLLSLIYFAVANMSENKKANVITATEQTPKSWPVASDDKHVSSGFGPRKHPIFKHIRKHRGIDIKADTGTPVLASSEGVIMEEGHHNKYGNYVIIRHNDRYSTRYMHLHTISVVSCDNVDAKTHIGTVGSTGLSTAPHLHFEILDNDIPVDPMVYLEP